MCKRKKERKKEREGGVHKNVTHLHRFKSLKHIPMEEHEEAWKCVEVEYSCPEFFYLQNKKEQLPPEEKSPPKKKSKADPMAIFEEPIDTTKDELVRYKELPPISPKSKPLEWWKLHEKEYPVLAQIAKIYLAIPASQATTERSFSRAGRICSEDRTSLTPKHVEQFVFSKQNYFELCDDY